MYSFSVYYYFFLNLKRFISLKTLIYLLLNQNINEIKNVLTLKFDIKSIHHSMKLIILFVSVSIQYTYYNL